VGDVDAARAETERIKAADKAAGAAARNDTGFVLSADGLIPAAQAAGGATMMENPQPVAAAKQESAVTAVKHQAAVAKQGSAVAAVKQGSVAAATEKAVATEEDGVIRMAIDPRGGASGHWGSSSLLRCPKCGAEETVDDNALFRHGWGAPPTLPPCRTCAKP
jgi:hypothetical protein